MSKEIVMIEFSNEMIEESIKQAKKRGLITLNRPEAINALSLDMVLRLSKILNEWAADSKIEAVAIRGTDKNGNFGKPTCSMTCWTSSSYSKIAHPVLHQHTARTLFPLSLTVCRLSVIWTLFHYHYHYSEPICPRPRCPRS